MNKKEIQRTINNIKKLENALITESLKHKLSYEKSTEVMDNLRNNLANLLYDLSKIKRGL